MKVTTSRTLYNVSDALTKGNKTMLIKTLGTKMSFQGTFKGG